MKVDIKNIEVIDLIDKYKELNSSYKVAMFFNTSATSVKRILKNAGVLRSQSNAAKDRGTEHLNKPRSKATKSKLSEIAKKRTGLSNPFYGKTHSKQTKQKLSNAAKQRTGKRNPNYKHGDYKRRGKDYLIAEFKPIRTKVFEIDSYTCQFCNKKGGDLHAHHRIPYWVCKEAYLDVLNLITCCKECHLKDAHNGDYARFNTSIISDDLIEKYNLDRERLNELADFNNKKSDAIV